MVLPEIVKIDLHLHLDGSILPATIWDLAQKQGVPAPAGTREEYMNYVNQRA